MHLKPEHPALSEARSIHTKLRKEPMLQKSILKPASANSKLGNGKGRIAKGAWRGFPLFFLTLEERATCPTTCDRWASCYGNAMPFAHRMESGATLEARLLLDVAKLAVKHPNGFAIRLHVLGDFYSAKYARLWVDMLGQFPALHIYGYTARVDGPISREILRGRVKYPSRFWVRFSTNKPLETPGAIHAVHAEHSKELSAIVCPEQTGKAKSCLDCALCWSVTRNIAFIDHDAKQKH